MNARKEGHMLPAKWKEEKKNSETWEFNNTRLRKRFNTIWWRTRIIERTANEEKNTRVRDFKTKITWQARNIKTKKDNQDTMLWTRDILKLSGPCLQSPVKACYRRLFLSFCRTFALSHSGEERIERFITGSSHATATCHSMTRFPSFFSVCMFGQAFFLLTWKSVDLKLNDFNFQSEPSIQTKSSNKNNRILRTDGKQVTNVRLRTPGGMTNIGQISRGLR